jgi:hypothetical protein
MTTAVLVRDLMLAATTGRDGAVRIPPASRLQLQGFASLVLQIQPKSVEVQELGF